MHVSLLVVTRCHSLCGWAGVERFSLPGEVAAGTPFHRQADYCVADVKERPLTAYSPTVFLFWTSCGKEKKPLNRWLSGTSSQVARQTLVVVFVQCGQWGKNLRKSGKNRGGCVAAALTDKSVAVEHITAQIRLLPAEPHLDRPFSVSKCSSGLINCMINTRFD